MSGRRAAAAAGLLVLCALGAAASASAEYRVQASAAPLADTPSRFVPQAEAPSSEMRPAGTPSRFGPAGGSSTFAPAAGPATRFRLAEVPPARLERTRELLDTLQARETPQQAIVIDLPADVLFDFDKAELRRDAGPRLQRLMEEVQARVPRPAFRVEGHTDWIGSDAYNLRLSARRAESVRNWLVQAGGVPRPAISTVGYGESRPVAPNSTPDGRDDPEGRQRNRRVELLVTPR